MIDMVRREVDRAMARVRLALRARLGAISLTTRVQRVQAEGLAGEQLRDVELFQQFGLTSAPPAGSQAIVLPLGGRTSAAVVVATEHPGLRFRLEAAGEVAIYNAWGDRVHLRKDRSIHVVAGSKVEVEAPLVTISGNVEIAGTLTVAGATTIGGSLAVDGAAVTHDGTAIGNSHTHGGVDPGPGNTGVPN